MSINVKVKLAIIHSMIGEYLEIKVKFPNKFFYKSFYYKEVNSDKQSYLAMGEYYKTPVNNIKDIYEFISNEDELREWVRLTLKDYIKQNKLDSINSVNRKMLEDKITEINKNKLEFTFTKEELEKE